MRNAKAGVGFVAIMGILLATLSPGTAAAPEPYRAFSDDSYWNTPLPTDAPLRPDSTQIVDFLRRDNTTNYVHLSGTDSTGRWGQPVYWAKAGDPVYNVKSTRYYVPPEFASLRIPRGAKPDPTADAEMTVYDLERGYVAGLYRAVYDAATDTWTAGGGEVFYLASNGLDARLPESNEPRNTGAHRGLPPPSYAIRYDEIMAGRIDHVVKIGINTVKDRSHVFPMTGNENGTTDPYAPPEGARIRINPTVDLSALPLSGPALTVARALQQYGAVIGDSTGGPVELKTENVVAEGRGHLWSGVLAANSLAAIPLSAYQVIEYGYRPPPPVSLLPVAIVSVAVVAALHVVRLIAIPARRPPRRRHPRLSEVGGRSGRRS